MLKLVTKRTTQFGAWDNFRVFRSLNTLDWS